MAEKIAVQRLIAGLREARVYDRFTQDKLDILAGKPDLSAGLGQKERTVVREIFDDYVQRVERDGRIVFTSLVPPATAGASAKSCEVTDFLGFGNMGPVYAVKMGGKPYALKMYSAGHLEEMMATHGRFGLGGILLDLEARTGAARLTDLGRRVLSKKPKDIYGRSRRMVKIHDVGAEPKYMFVLMDLLAVDPINKVDPRALGGDVSDIVSWGVDCAVALCHLHVEESRLHLNIRPEAFIRHAVNGPRLPKYCFFHYPKTYHRPERSPSLTTEFIMVDHLDNSVDIGDKGPKGLGTVGSWPFVPPEAILQLLKILRVHYDLHVENGRRVEEPLTIKLARTQMDDAWAFGLTFYQFLTGGRNPFGEPRSLVDMVNSILLTKFDFSPVPPLFRDLISSALEKDPKMRFSRLLEGCPDKLKSRRVVAEAILFKLEQIGLRQSS